MFHLYIFQDTSIVIYVFRYTYICLCVSAHCGGSEGCCCQGLIYFLSVLVYKCFQGETFCDCPSQRAAGCIVYRDIMLPPSLWGLWQCCSVLCSACSPLSTQSEAGSQQDLDAQQACPGSAEATVCVQREPKVAPSHCHCVEVLGSHQCWSWEWDGLGVKCFL